MPATLLMKAGEPKLLDNRKSEQTLVQEQIGSARKPKEDQIWSSLESTSGAITERPHSHPKLRNNMKKPLLSHLWKTFKLHSK